MSNVSIPEKMLAWPLFGAGMENFGVNDCPCTIPVPEIGPDELLCGSTRSAFASPMSN